MVCRTATRLKVGMQVTVFEDDVDKGMAKEGGLVAVLGRELVPSVVSSSLEGLGGVEAGKR